MLIVLFLLIGSNFVMKEDATANEPSDIKAMIREAYNRLPNEERLSSDDVMQPPWLYLQGEPMSSLVWRMGHGEDYRLDFFEWFFSKSDEYRLAYKRDFQEPPEWQGYYAIIEERQKGLGAVR
jgi:hypothetical protein